MSSVIDRMWSAWVNGDVLGAKKLATSLSATAEGRHILFLCAFVTGNYEEALLHYRAIDASYGRYAQLDKPVIQAYLHLSRYAEAERFARGQRFVSGLSGLTGVRYQLIGSQTSASDFDLASILLSHQVVANRQVLPNGVPDVGESLILGVLLRSTTGQPRA